MSLLIYCLQFVTEKKLPQKCHDILDGPNTKLLFTIQITSSLDTHEKVQTIVHQGIIWNQLEIQKFPIPQTPFHFLVHLHFKLVSLLLAICATQMTTEMISQMIEYYQFKYHFAVSQKR